MAFGCLQGLRRCAMSVQSAAARSPQLTLLEVMFIGHFCTKGVVWMHSLFPMYCKVMLFMNVQSALNHPFHMIGFKGMLSVILISVNT